MPFHYGDQELSRRAIRLLQVNPGPWDSPISCELLVCDLDEPPSYNARSYVWGSPAETVDILCNGQRHPITRNLHDALQHVRARAETLPLWVDAVCINQLDIPEKTRQVRMMRKIYATAERVVAWLGIAGPEVEVALELLSRIHLSVPEWENSETNAEQSTLPEELGMPVIGDDAWRSLADFLTRPWFGRIWIVQELISAASCQFLCGQHHIESAFLFSAVGAIMRMSSIKLAISHLMTPEGNVHPDLKLGPVFSLTRLKSWIAQGTSFRLFELCQILLEFQASYSCDHVFALVGLSADIDEDFIDYSLDSAEVFIRVARLGLTSSSAHADVLCGIDLLSYSSSCIPEEGQLGTSSWAPRFHTYTTDSLPLAVSFPSHSAVPEESFKFDQVFGLMLELEASETDNLCEIVKAPVVNDRTVAMSNYMEAVRDNLLWDGLCSSLVLKEPSVLYRDYRSEAFWRTLCFNRGNDKELPSHAYRAYLQSWRHTQWLLLFSSSKDKEMRWTSLVFFEWFNNSIIFEFIAFELFKSTWHKSWTAWAIRMVIWELVVAFISLFLESLFRNVIGELLKVITIASNIFDTSIKRHSLGRRFCTTTHGLMGWVPKEAKVGDSIWRVKGSRLPYVLRRCVREKNERNLPAYELVGAAYMHGLMGGSDRENSFGQLDIIKYRKIYLI